jgi:hypothetical protein
MKHADPASKTCPKIDAAGATGLCYKEDLQDSSWVMAHGKTTTLARSAISG